MQYLRLLGTFLEFVCHVRRRARSISPSRCRPYMWVTWIDLMLAKLLTLHSKVACHELKKAIVALQRVLSVWKNGKVEFDISCRYRVLSGQVVSER